MILKISIDLAIPGNVGVGRNTVVEGMDTNYTVYVEDYKICMI